MELKELDFLLDFYGQEQLPFHYFRDQYALQLLSYQLGEKGNSIAEIKRSPLSFLLDKPILKKITASLKGNRLNVDDLQYFEAEDTFYFDLTFSKWGQLKRHRNDSWYQTSRPGNNLVLQLNFGALHDRDYHKLIQPNKEHPFRWTCHPVADNNKLTMAWARLDIDLDRGEVLIEEVQNDWLRNVLSIHQTVTRMIQKKNKHIHQHYLFRATKCSPELFIRYSEEVVAPYHKIWQEAMLSACIHFIRKELEITTIYYHTHEGGKLLKNCEPPRSVYSTLPRKFGFQRTSEAPQFIRECAYLRKKLKTNSIEWFRMKTT